MNQCLIGLQNCMGSNLNMLQDVFTKFHNIGNHWSQLEGHIIERFKADVDNLNILEKHEEYLHMEVPAYDPQLILSDELDDDPDRLRGSDLLLGEGDAPFSSSMAAGARGNTEMLGVNMTGSRFSSSAAGTTRVTGQSL